MKEYKSFEEFWPYYIGEHKKASTRLFHFIGTSLIIPLIIISILFNLYFLLLIPLVVYSFAWFSHYFIEKNKPATIKYPLWSILGDFKMSYLMLTGKIEEEIIKSENIK